MQTKTQQTQVAAGTAPQLSALDPEVIATLRKFQKPGTELLKRVSTIYVKEAPAALVNIERAADRKSFVELATTAHALKSMSANIGARYVAAACNCVEKCALNEEAADYLDLIASVRKSLDDALPEIATLS